MDLSPAKWIWLPSQRTLANSVVLFRREFLCFGTPRRATGWIVADSRYRLSVNGHRVQWGPAPSDPREQEVDPFDITEYLWPGHNVIGVEVLYYGHGEGTWAMGKPGLLLNFELEHGSGQRDRIATDRTWLAKLDRARPPGQYKRWYLRSLQEQFDARLHPHKWDTPEYSTDGDDWLHAAVTGERADKPSLCTNYDDYAGGASVQEVESSRLVERSIPRLKEVETPAKCLAAQGVVAWKRDPSDWFENRVPNSFEIRREEVAAPAGPGAWTLRPEPGSGAFLTFEFAEELVGWPHFTIEAPEGTVVELMVQESHDPEKTLWLDSQFFAWSRFICQEGRNRFETFDYEAFRWVQLHVRNATGPVTVRDVGARRRIYPWPNAAQVKIDEPPMQRLFDACVNTLNNSAQDIVVDGMARERQQYSGDCGHQLPTIRYAFGETRQPARFLRTYSAGLTLDGYFLDCWPAYDRLARIAQRQVGATPWGPLLDHGVQLAFDAWDHYFETADKSAIEPVYPRLVRFADYLRGIVREDGLLPVEGIGVPTVWIDHEAYLQQRHKRCAFNLYVAAMLEHAMAPLARLFGENERAESFVALGRDLLGRTVQAFWSTDRRAFVNNLPWMVDEGSPRLDDRSLATAVIYGQCPGGDVAESIRCLADLPPDTGLSYPPNAIWRYRALCGADRADVAVKDFRIRWATIESVLQNNTLGEWWNLQTDGRLQWSHCPIAPLLVLMTDLLGLRPTSPGFETYRIRPRLADLSRLELTAHTVRGPVRAVFERTDGWHRVRFTDLPDGQGELVLPKGSRTKLEQTGEDAGTARYRLKPDVEALFLTDHPSAHADARRRR